MFIGRREELERLKGYYETHGNSFVVVYGREGMGKTTLAGRFAEGKNAFFYRAGEATKREQYIRLAREVYRYTGRTPFDEGGYTDDIEPEGLERLLSSVLNHNKGTKSLIIIDEFRYIAEADSDFASDIASLIAGAGEDGLMIVLISSSVSWVENRMVSETAPCARLISEIMKIDELKFSKLVEAFPNAPIEDIIMIYSFFGGIPKYFERFSTKQSVRDNMVRLVLGRNSVFVDEAEKVLKTELRELPVYNAILSCLAAGRIKLNEIHHYTGFTRAKVSVYLKNLIQMDLVEKVFSYDSVNREDTKKGLYIIKDNFLNFWYRFVFNEYSLVEAGKGGQIFDTVVTKELSGYMRPRFARVCGEYLKLMSDYGRLSNRYVTWSSRYGKQATIDWVAEDENGKLLTAVCLYQDVPADSEIIGEYMAEIERSGMKPVEMFFFSKSGFARDVSEVYGETIKLVSMDEF